VAAGDDGMMSVESVKVRVHFLFCSFFSRLLTIFVLLHSLFAHDSFVCSILFAPLYSQKRLELGRTVRLANSPRLRPRAAEGVAPIVGALAGAPPSAGDAAARATAAARPLTPLDLIGPSPSMDSFVMLSTEGSEGEQLALSPTTTRANWRRAAFRAVTPRSGPAFSVVAGPLHFKLPRLHHLGVVAASSLPVGTNTTLAFSLDSRGRVLIDATVTRRDGGRSEVASAPPKVGAAAVGGGAGSGGALAAVNSPQSGTLITPPRDNGGDESTVAAKPSPPSSRWRRSLRTPAAPPLSTPALDDDDEPADAAAVEFKTPGGSAGPLGRIRRLPWPLPSSRRAAVAAAAGGDAGVAPFLESGEWTPWRESGDRAASAAGGASTGAACGVAGGDCSSAASLCGEATLVQVSFLLFTVTCYANVAHSLTRSP
jgi:hypothetical protein